MNNAAGALALGLVLGLALENEAGNELIEEILQYGSVHRAVHTRALLVGESWAAGQGRAEEGREGQRRAGQDRAMGEAIGIDMGHRVRLYFTG